MLEFTSKEQCHDSIFPVLLQNRKNRLGIQRKLNKALLLHLNYTFMSLTFDNQDGNDSQNKISF